MTTPADEAAHLFSTAPDVIEAVSGVLAPIELLAREGATHELQWLSDVIDDLIVGARVFERHEGPFVTIFGSARTPLDDPIAIMAERLAQRLRERGWMVVTGAGPGIMAAAAKGAGIEGNIGINIRLPFEHGSNPWVDVENNHVAARHFFTRKVLLVQASHAFVVFPGGVGTMDELFEILTLLNTNRAEPAPVVLMDQPGGTFWQDWTTLMQRIVDDEYLSPGDDAMYFLSDDIATALEHIEGFYRVFESSDIDDGVATLVVRHELSGATLSKLTTLVGSVTSTHSDEGEWSVSFAYDGRRYALLSTVITTINADRLVDVTSAQ